MTDNHGTSAADRAAEHPAAADPAAENPVPEGTAGSLSPSRANDFTKCPLLYRFRAIDKLPEPVDAAMARGTLVHAVLEDLLEDPAPDRTLERARDMIGPRWQQLTSDDSRLRELFGPDDTAAEAQWLAGATQLLETYFDLEDPRTLGPTDRELRVSWQATPELTLHGIVDRLDHASDGRTRVVDYKTGKSPGPRLRTRLCSRCGFMPSCYGNLPVSCRAYCS